MKQQTKILVLSAIVLPAGAALAAPPVGYDGWTASNGTIDTSLSCSGGVTCTTLAEDSGFIQEKVVVDDYEYIRLIVTDPNAHGAAGDQTFTSEAFVPFALNDDGISQGVAAKHVIRDATQGFIDQAEIQRSMMRFRDPGMRNPGDISENTPADEMWSVRLNQSFDTPEFKSSFEYTNWTEMVSTFPAATPDTNDIIGYVMSLSQEIPLNPDGSAVGVDPNASQGFEHRQISGDMGNIPALFFPSNYFSNAPLSPAGSVTLGGETVSWSAEETVSTNWVVQTNLMNADEVGMNYQNVTNHDTDATASELAIGGQSTPVTPFDWDDPTFGTEPVFPTP